MLKSHVAFRPLRWRRNSCGVAAPLPGEYVFDAVARKMDCSCLDRCPFD
jgi:hypothetical protein